MKNIAQVLSQMAPTEGILIDVVVSYPDGGGVSFIEPLDEVFENDFPIMLMEGGTITLKMVEGEEAEKRYEEQEKLYEM